MAQDLRRSGQSDREQILQAMSVYVHALDGRAKSGELERLHQIFDESTRWTNAHGTFVGTVEIMAHLQSPPRARHLNMNIEIDVKGDRASAISDWICIYPGQPWTIGLAGQYVDQFRCKNGRWVFEAREVQFYPVPGAESARAQLEFIAKKSGRPSVPP